MDIREAIRQGEGYDLEFKRVPNEERIRYLKTVVAFANGKGGTVLFGIANDGSVTGIGKSRVFVEMDGIANSICNACSPHVPIDIGIENVDGKSVIVLDVLAGSRCPYFIKAEGDKDGVYVRVGATTQRADDATRHELELEAEGRSFDSEPCPNAKITDARIAALCANMYRIARRNARDESERKAVKKITANQLQEWGIISKSRNCWIASNTYALLTGDRAFATRVKCGVFKGDSKAVFVDRREFTGPIYEQIEDAHKYILSKINMGCVFEGIQRRDLYELPPDALRELVVNAFTHRNYFEHDAPIFVAVYDTRVEITSPGGLPRGLTVEKVLSGRSKIRNHALAEAFNYMKVIEQWGSGLRRVSEELAAYGARPLQLEDGGIDVRVNVFRNAAAPEPSHAAPQGSPQKTTRNGALIGTVDGTMDGTMALRIVGVLEKEPSITLDKLSERLNVARRSLVRHMNILQESNRIKRIGGKRFGHWEVLSGQGRRGEPPLPSDADSAPPQHRKEARA
ncbi:MAG: putative DNA binding domain-containing protein [Kiritimatiellae bacterium]|nr:putative DNA binding domain-containing protein [Kiritimatiellia bacterium]